MILENKHTTSIVMDSNKNYIEILDQRQLPHRIVWERLHDSEAVAVAIEEMHLRGAPLIGAAAAFGYCFAIGEAMVSDDFDHALKKREIRLRHTRPTAINLNWAIDRMIRATATIRDLDEKLNAAWVEAHKIVSEDIDACHRIGQHGLPLIESVFQQKKDTVNILMHCNPGWLACLDWGTATAPIYLAHQKNIPIHVWVDETRPRNQGAKLTAFELGQQGVPFSVITDNTGGYLMQQGLVDLVLVGTDRTTLNGDVANKIGTYLKALAAKDNGIPFYVALPSSTFDTKIQDALREIPIETRTPREVTHADGELDGAIREVQITPPGAPAVNYGFDITPSRLVTALVTERGVCSPNRNGILNLFPEFAH